MDKYAEAEVDFEAACAQVANIATQLKVSRIVFTLRWQMYLFEMHPDGMFELMEIESY
jgi:hypothetical protein